MKFWQLKIYVEIFSTVKTDLKKIEQRLRVGPLKIAIFGIFEKIMFFLVEFFFFQKRNFDYDGNHKNGQKNGF